MVFCIRPTILRTRAGFFLIMSLLVMSERPGTLMPAFANGSVAAGMPFASPCLPGRRP
jgi:hypothetical protein